MSVFGSVEVMERGKRIILVNGVKEDFYVFVKVQENSNLLEPKKIRGSWDIEREVYEQLWLEGYIII
jgi:hypothetical protein